MTLWALSQASKSNNLTKMAFQAWTFAFTKTSVNEQNFEQDFEKIF